MMAWRSSGTDNDSLVNNLKRFGVISSPAVEAAFRQVDRYHFVPMYWKDMAHADQPLKEGNVHISAPHIYGSVMESLDLVANSTMTFLHAGSGTGYFTCIAATLMGPRSSHFCVEIHEDVVKHSKNAITTWKEHLAAGTSPPNIDIFRGNALNLNLEKGECGLGFDRIYIGAAIEESDLPRFKQLLKPGGILVGPVEDELIRVVRKQSQPSTESSSPQFVQQVISPVRFAPLLSRPAIQTIIPARIWHPSNHLSYPDSFRKSCKAVMLCSSNKYEQPVPRQDMVDRVNVASLLPRALWLEILSYTHRDWFEAPQSEIEFLRQQLAEERSRREKAEAEKLEAEARCQRAEKEREVYMLLARGWRDRLKSSLGPNEKNNLNEIESVEEAVASMLIRSRGNISPLGLSHLVRSVGRTFVDYSRENNNSNNHGDDSSHEGGSDGDGDSNMEEEVDEEMIVDNDDAAVPNQQNHAALAAVGTNGRALVVAKSIAAAGHPRTISISDGADI